MLLNMRGYLRANFYELCIHSLGTKIERLRINMYLTYLVIKVPESLASFMYMQKTKSKDERLQTFHKYTGCD